MAPTEMSKSGRMQVVVVAPPQTGGWLHRAIAQMSARWQRWRAGKRQA